mmetsp:Transcript_12487/g.34330  ORF Transcript_12487/g.34330 Transcript_12487/m.34330 type:complete len:376 (+) Transcript_12487:88-1215(+)
MQVEGSLPVQQSVHVESAAADELAEEGRDRHGGLGPRRQRVQHRQQLLRRGEVRVVGAHPAQQTFEATLEDRQLVLHRRVEHEVGVVLVGEDPGVLAAPHVGPHGQRLGGAVAAEEEVAADAPAQPVLGALDDVVVVDAEHRDGRDVDAVLLLGGDRGGVLGVERVDALDDEHAPRRKLQLLPRGVAEAGLHVVHRGHDRLAVGQLVDVLLDELHVHGLDRVVVHVPPVLARLVLGLAVQRQVVVVDGEGDGGHADAAEGEGELVGEGGLAGGGGPSDADNLDLVLGVARGHLARHVGDAALEAHLGGVHEDRLLPRRLGHAAQVAHAREAAARRPEQLVLDGTRDGGLRLVAAAGHEEEAAERVGHERHRGVGG